MVDKRRDDTIFAIATAAGRAGVAIIRVSGSNAHEVVETLTGAPPPEPRRMSLRNLSANGALLDEALVVIFGEGASFTGEAMAELHVHGGRATAAGVVSALSELGFCRPADPGEFTRRALENGRLDLAQVEGLADLIDAETEAQRQQAMALMQGELSDQAMKWRGALVGALALLEASIDFADEEDAPVDVGAEVAATISDVHRDLAQALSGSAAAERIREGFVVALVGPPNAGKSSLLNALVGREAAIASPVAGTTRDIIEAVCDFDGVPVVLTDMAGLRKSEDVVERIGVDRAVQKARAADLRVFMTAPDASDSVDVKVAAGDILVDAKSDLRVSAAETESSLAVSVVTGEGVAELKKMIAGRLSDRAGHASLIGRARQKAAVHAALEALDQAREEKREELCAALLRTAIAELSGLLGEVGVEDVLDDIFSRFCMGK